MTDHTLIPDIEAFEERAAIAQYDGGLSRSGAEDLAARAQGFPGSRSLLDLAGGLRRKSPSRLNHHLGGFLRGLAGGYLSFA